jgi:hypothetical protein
MHSHQRAVKTEIFGWNGKERGERVYENTDWHSPVPLDLTKSPRKVKAGEGFEFHCHYQNPTNEAVKLARTSAPVSSASGTTARDPTGGVRPAVSTASRYGRPLRSHPP